jgi:hypothetical protein
MRKLPNIYKNDITKKIDNNEMYYYSVKEDRNDTIELDGKNVIQKINSIFKSNNYIYKAEVEIKLKDKVVNKTIIGKNKTHLITVNNELIPISDILDIKKSLK